MPPVGSVAQRAVELACRLGLVPEHSARAASEALERGALAPEPAALGARLGLDADLLDLLLALAEVMPSPEQATQGLQSMLAAVRQARKQQEASTRPDAPPVSQAFIDTVRRHLEALPTERVDRSGPPRFEGYESAVEINRGGMGAILQALDPAAGRHVALKLLLDDSHPQRVERFLAEGRITAQLEHPNIVPVHQVGLSQDGRLFFAMKLVKGRSLDQVLREEPAGDDRRRNRLLGQFLKVCDAVAFAHSRGVIHRDLKPSNVMLGEFGEVLVMDWGIARMTNDERRMTNRDPEVGAGDRTMDGTVMGTPAYMPPEQARGEVGRIDQTSDIYALGAMLYELLCGERPFEGVTSEAILGAVLAGRLVPPSVRAPQRRIPRELEAVVLKAMAPKQEQRYGSVPELAEDIQAWLDGRVLSAARYNPLQRLAKWAWRRRTILAPAAVLCVVLAGMALHAWTRPGYLVLRVTPLGSTVEVAGHRVEIRGVPQELALPAGRYRLRITRSGHDPVTREQDVRRRERHEVVVRLARHTESIEVVTHPAGARVLIDGVYHGTPLRDRRLVTGRRTLWVEKRGHYRQPLDVELVKGRPLRYEVSLPPAVAWSHEYTDYGHSRLVPDVDGDGVQDLLYLHYGVVFILFSGADGKPLVQRRLPLQPETPEWLQDVDGDRVPELVTCLVDGGRYRLAALRLRDGEPAWTSEPLPILTRLQAGLGHTPSPMIRRIADDVLVLLAGPTLSRFSGRDGKPIWRAALPEPLWKPDAGGILLGKRTIHAIDLATGKTRWSRPRPPGAGWLQPLPGGRELVHPAPGGLVYLDALSGKELRRAACETEVAGATAWFHDADGGRELLRLQQHDGVLRCWRLDAGRLAWSMPLELAPGNPVPGGLLALDAGRQSVLRLDLERGAVRWRRPLGWPVDRLALVAGRLLVWGGKRAALIDPEQGALHWEREFPSAITCAGVEGDFEGDGRPELAFGLGGGQLIWLRLDGSECWSALVQPAIHRITPCDLDRDGLQDCLVESLGGPTAVLGRRIRWQREMAGAVRPAPVLHDADGDGAPDVLLPVTDPERGAGIIALDGRSGATRWFEQHPSDMIRALGLLRLDGRVLAVTWKTDHKLRLLDAADGRLVADLPVPSFGYASPAIGDLDGDGVPDLVAAGWWYDGACGAISGRTRSLMWKVTAGSAVWSAPTLADVTGDGRPEVFLATLGGQVLALDGASGRPLWRARAGPAVRAAVTVGRLRASGPPVALVNATDGALYAFDATNGVLLRTLAGAGGSASQPVLVPAAGGLFRVLVGTSSGLLLLDDGLRVVWRVKSAAISARPVVADLQRDGKPVVLVGTTAGILLCVDLASGRLRWSWRAPGRNAQIESAVAAGDLDGDGTLEIVVTGHGRRITCLTGAGRR